MKTYILDSSNVPSTENMAVLQTLYSRSNKSVLEHLLNVNQTKSQSMIEKYYVGYSHDSVLDSTSICICIEGVSILCAKAIQDNPLYSGTECSTRYIDFSTQPFYNPMPIEDIETVKIHQKLRDFYTTNLPLVVEANKLRFPIEEGQSQTVYDNAIKAKSFDIMRAFLPAGATTNLSWVGSLRNINERLQILRFHPLQEVVNIAYNLIDQLAERYPASCKKNRMNPEVIEFIKANQDLYFDSNPYFTENLLTWLNKNKSVFISWFSDTQTILENSYCSLKDRPKHCPIPKMPGVSNIEIQSYMDYGSYRDIQRHRNCVQKVPILDINNGFESWYLDNLPSNMKAEAVELLTEIESFLLSKLSTDPLLEYKLQYFTPMGYKVCNLISMSVPQCVYVAELRSGKSVHPTARTFGLALADFLESEIPTIKIYPDRDLSEWNINRGTQTITEAKG